MLTFWAAKHRKPTPMLRALISLAVLVSAIAGPAAAGDLLIRNAALATADREKPLRGAWVLVEDGVVAEIGTGKAPAASAVIDARGKWVTPGLIDSHVHVWGDGGIREDSAEENPALLETFHAQEPRSFLYFGFTTLIDLKKSRGAVDRWNRQATAPALFACRDAPFANGYGMGFEPPEVRFENHPFYYADPAKTALLPPGDDPAEHTPEAVVAAVAADGDAICIKTFHERGFSGLFNFEAPDAALEARIERAARRAGLVHVLHATSLDSWDVGARAEAGVMAHGLWHWEELAPRGVKTLPDEIASMLDIMIRNGTAFQLTARILQGEIDHYRPEFLQDPRLAAALPPGVLAYYAGPDGAWFRDALEARIAKAPGLLERFLGRAPTGETAETSKTALVRLRLQAAYLRQHSGLILFGTDTPSSPGYGNPPGLNGRLEMDALAAMGFTPREILRAETLDNARVFNLAGRGCLDAGCRADLLILGANPLESVDAFDRIEAVILGGRPMARESLAASRLTKK